MSDDVTLRDVLRLCPFQSIVGVRGADLLGDAPAAILAAPSPGRFDHDEDVLDEVRDVLREGGSVLVLATTHTDREALLDLIGIADADRVRTWGRA